MMTAFSNVFAFMTVIGSEIPSMTTPSDVIAWMREGSHGVAS